MITLVFFLISYLQVFLSAASSSNAKSNESSSSFDANIKAIIAIVVICGVALILIACYCYCYFKTKKIEVVAIKIRLSLAQEYQNALAMKLSEAIKVNSSLLKSLAPDRLLLGRSMMKSSWKRSMDFFTRSDKKKAIVLQNTEINPLNTINNRV